MDSPISSSLFSPTKKNAKAINVHPIKSEPTASYTKFPVTSVRYKYVPAIVVLKSAAKSFTNTDNTKVSLLYINSSIIERRVNFSLLSSFSFLNSPKDFLNAFPSNINKNPNIMWFIEIYSILDVSIQSIDSTPCYKDNTFGIPKISVATMKDQKNCSLPYAYGCLLVPFLLLVLMPKSSRI